MTQSLGTNRSCPAFKSVYRKLGSMFCNCDSTNRYKRLDTLLERKIVQVKKNELRSNSFRSINSIIMRFPQFKEGLKNIRAVFEQYDEDSNGSIDREELNKCLEKLHVNLNEEDTSELFHSCDMDGSEGIQFNEFIVLLCLIYLLIDSSNTSKTMSKIGSPQLEATFDTIVEAFLFLDKNGDGKLNKKDLVKALNEASPQEKSPAKVNRTRFKEMDWNRSGKVSFREFLFALVDWVGIDNDNESSAAET